MRTIQIYKCMFSLSRLVHLAKALISNKIGLSGATVGGIVGGVVIILVALFFCRRVHRRHSISNRERQMTEGWLSVR